MYKKLEDYLKEIDHYLAVKEGKDEILSEIKSHILEKTEQEFGTVSEKTLEKIIANYGNPRKVASQYLEGEEIISPFFKKYVFLYTGILFVFHLGLTLLSLIFGWSIVIFPFFYIPSMDNLWALCYLPMALVYDFGLVCLFFYLVTQVKIEIRLPWPKIKWRLPEPREKKWIQPKIIFLVLMLVGFSIIVYAYLKYHTLFFISLDFKNQAESLLNPEASRWYSLFLITIVACEIIVYGLRFFIQSEWIALLKNAFYLVLVWVVMNNPIEDALVRLRTSDLEFVHYFVQRMGIFIVVVFGIVAAIDFLQSLWRISRKRWQSR
jgi:hypothetical protein